MEFSSATNTRHLIESGISKDEDIPTFLEAVDKYLSFSFCLILSY